MTTTLSPNARPRFCRISEAPEQISARRPFIAGDGTMRGQALTSMPPTGRLDDPELSQLQSAIDATHEAGGQTFVVFSYSTPIAWTTPDGELVVPAVRYTVTTSKHQRLARQAQR